MRLGLMGGTFDPIHFGHLFIAEEARVRYQLGEVLFFPNNQPAHRQGKDAFAPPEIRLQLTEIAIANNPYFRTSRIELDRPGPSYAFDTLQQLKSEYGNSIDENSGGVELFYIVGADSMNEVLTWYRGAELFELCRFVAASRPGFDLDKARAKLTSAQRERVLWMEVPGLHIASRDLRKRVQQNEPIRYLTPDPVVEAIERLKLYHSNTQS